MNPEPTRQVHLDFHTSEFIPEIGTQFDKTQFQSALQIGRVNQINVFAKCHHSWSYYPTNVGDQHPHLTRDLLGQQLEACHEIGVVAPIYFTVGWSAHDAEEHPEWCLRASDGSFSAAGWPSGAEASDPKPIFQWKDMCVGTEYHDLVVAQTEEICTTYEVDGFWYDIYFPDRLCYCESCRAGMKSAGIDVKDTPAVEAYRAGTIRDHCAELVKLIASRHADASIYFNGLTVLEKPHNFRYRLFEANTKNDLEDLPSAWGGYDKFPLRSKLFHREGKPIVAMSGKFHSSWGEFGGFKNPEAIRYEAAAMIAFGSRCNFGDHLHPSGVMDETTYANIGHAYSYVEQIEEYGIGGLPEASLGLWVSHDADADQGVSLMLLEEQIDFNVVGAEDDLSRFQTIVVPSAPGVLEGATDKIGAYMEDGGTLMVLGAGALDRAESATVVACAASYAGPARFDVDYTVADAALLGAPPTPPQNSLTPLTRLSAVPSTPFLNQTGALRFDLHDGATLLASIQEPYFSRTYGSYCGHQNTPNQPVSAAHPAAWRAGNAIVLAHPLDRIYLANGAKVHRDFFARALRLLHTEPMIEAALPSTGRVSFLHQQEESRYVAHLLYGPPVARGRYLVIEDLPELRDVQVRLRVPHHVKSLRLIPDEVELPVERVPASKGARGRFEIIETTVPAFSAHCAVVAEY